MERASPQALKMNMKVCILPDLSRHTLQMRKLLKTVLDAVKNSGASGQTATMCDTNFVSFNVKGLNILEKKSMILNNLKAQKAQVAFFQETHFKSAKPPSLRNKLSVVNQTVLSELLLSGLSDLPSLQLPLFLFFLLIYILTLTWNLLIISLIITDSHLHTPMYFFLGNLACLDLCFSSVSNPRTLFDLFTKRRVITIPACITQVFLFFFCAGCEIFLLAVMSIDRYLAICHPLHYMQIMRRRVCVLLALGVWCLSFIHSLLHTLYSLKLTFCGSNTIKSFFCELPQLLQISCSDIFINVLLIFLEGGFLSFGSLMITFLPYVYIIKTVMKIQVEGSRRKVFSTCSSHLTVVFIFYASGMFNYFQPMGGNQFAGNKVMAVFYTVITPLLNPLIYSLRSQDLRSAFGAILMRIASGILGHICAHEFGVGCCLSSSLLIQMRNGFEREEGSHLQSQPEEASCLWGIKSLDYRSEPSIQIHQQQ
ncbi:olfactory receptor 5AR1-like [Gastrophryne carolinensis]